MRWDQSPAGAELLQRDRPAHDGAAAAARGSGERAAEVGGTTLEVGQTASATAVGDALAVVGDDQDDFVGRGGDRDTRCGRGSMPRDVAEGFAQHGEQLLAHGGRNERVDGTVEPDLRLEAERAG